MPLFNYQWWPLVNILCKGRVLSKGIRLHNMLLFNFKYSWTMALTHNPALSRIILIHKAFIYLEAVLIGQLICLQFQWASFRVCINWARFGFLPSCWAYYRSFVVHKCPNVVDPNIVLFGICIQAVDCHSKTATVLYLHPLKGNESQSK